MPWAKKTSEAPGIHFSCTLSYFAVIEWSELNRKDGREGRRTAGADAKTGIERILPEFRGVTPLGKNNRHDGGRERGSDPRHVAEVTDLARMRGGSLLVAMFDGGRRRNKKTAGQNHTGQHDLPVSDATYGHCELSKV
jgi:hypothetical protein